MSTELLENVGPSQSGKIIEQPPGDVVTQIQIGRLTPTTDHAVSAGDTTRPGKASVGRRPRTPQLLS